MVTEINTFKPKEFAVDVGGLRLPITISFKGAPTHADFFVIFAT